MSPRGRPLTQSRIAELAAGAGPLIICGRFEGIDQRVIEARKLEEVSVGDYRAVGRRNRSHGADRRLRPAFARRHGKTGIGRRREFLRRAPGIPSIYPPAAIRGPAYPGNPQFRRPRPDRGLAAGRSRGSHQGETGQIYGAQANPAKDGPKTAKKPDRRVTTPCLLPYRGAKSAHRG